MAVKAKISGADHTALPTDVQSHYTVGEGGMFFLDVTPTDGLELANLANLKTTMEKERSQREVAEKLVKDLTFRLTQFDGIESVEEAREAIKKVAEMPEWDEAKKIEEIRGQIERQITDKLTGEKTAITEKYTAESEAFTKKVDVLTGQLKKALISAEATKAISGAKGSVELLRPIVEGSTRLKENTDGTFSVEVFGADGITRISPASQNNNPMTIEEFVGTLKNDDKFGRAFDASGASGSGSAQSKPGGSAFTGNAMKISMADSRDVTKYRAAREAAEKAGVPLEIADA